jgi:hypothetical protein
VKWWKHGDVSHASFFVGREAKDTSLCFLPLLPFERRIFEVKNLSPGLLNKLNMYELTIGVKLHGNKRLI